MYIMQMYSLGTSQLVIKQVNKKNNNHSINQTNPSLLPLKQVQNCSPNETEPNVRQMAWKLVEIGLGVLIRKLQQQTEAI